MNERQMTNGSTDRLERKIDTLTDTVGKMDTRLGRVEQELGGVAQAVGELKLEVGGLKHEVGGLQQEVGGLKREVGRMDQEIGGAKQEIVGVKQELHELGNRVTKVYVLAENTDQFTKNAWDSLESLRTNVAKGFEEAKKERELGFQLVHSAIRHLGEKVQRIEEAPSRARNREL